MIAAVVESYVEVENITVFELALVGDTVADDFVDGGADRLWEADIVEGRGVGLALVRLMFLGTWGGDLRRALYILGGRLHQGSLSLRQVWPRRRRYRGLHGRVCKLSSCLLDPSYRGL